MKNEEHVTSAFDETININIEAKNLLDHHIELLKSLSKTIKDSIYVVDFQSKCFRFVSERGIFLCGRTSAEVLQLRFNFYDEVVHQDDLPMINKVFQVISHYFSFPDTALENLICMVFNFRIYGGRKYLMVSHKVVPLIVSDSAQFAVCIVSDSILETSGNLYAYYKNGKRYKYSLEGYQWILDTQIMLTPREKKIIQWTKQGKSVREIADFLCLSDKTIRNQKVILFEKLGVKNMLQCITYVENHFLI